jgi:uncharacterized protein YerC
MGNYLKMTDKRRILALLELGWPYRRIERETGVRRETIGRYDRGVQERPACRPARLEHMGHRGWLWRTTRRSRLA